jgi:hypothetical protein
MGCLIFDVKSFWALSQLGVAVAFEIPGKNESEQPKKPWVLTLGILASHIWSA